MSESLFKWLINHFRINQCLNDSHRQAGNFHYENKAPFFDGKFWCECLIMITLLHGSKERTFHQLRSGETVSQSWCNKEGDGTLSWRQCIEIDFAISWLGIKARKEKTSHDSVHGNLEWISQQNAVNSSAISSRMSLHMNIAIVRHRNHSL